MAWITHTRACHTCGSTELTRYHRAAWMRLFRGSQLLRCRLCRSSILLLRGRQGPADEPSGSER